jgi:hypothetical protein
LGYLPFSSNPHYNWNNWNNRHNRYNRYNRNNWHNWDNWHNRYNRNDRHNWNNWHNWYYWYKRKNTPHNICGGGFRWRLLKTYGSLITSLLGKAISITVQTIIISVSLTLFSAVVTIVW